MSNLQVHINEEIVGRYKAEGLSMDLLGSVLIILFALYEQNYKLLDYMDDGNKQNRVLIIYQYLHRKKFLELSDDSEDSLYALTEKGIEFIKFCESFSQISSNEKSYSKNVEPMTKLDTDNQTQNTDNPNDWIQEWINLFPEGKIDGRYLRTNKMECADRMAWFTKAYGFSKQTIFSATKLYLESQESSQSGHTYTRNSSYFIFKGRSKQERTSDLATWCQRVEGGEETKEYIERDAV